MKNAPAMNNGRGVFFMGGSAGHVGWVKRAKLSTTAPPPIARNPSPADGMTPQWLKTAVVLMARLQNPCALSTTPLQNPWTLSTTPLQNPWVLAAALQNSTVA
ncbi:hypothetical protein [Achromobacter spanius]